eukprot:TRINITY_DN1106_c0_g1_i4.p1 TRINITY_DN1106_c0_g1~~TRINITY_DN1106_c0_g1_i4.p1  ORF type:complete len:617 (+),score=193.87 TRINITY_DN1106_c0_g1_i4:258-2108(+)
MGREAEKTGNDSNQNSEIASKPIGLILPPKKIREIADRTAEFVAKNGSTFEEVLMKEEASNPKFSFLKQGDPYRPYFDSKVVEYAKALAAGREIQREETPAPAPAPAPLPVASTQMTLVQSRDFKKEIKREVRPPPPNQFIIQHPKVPPMELEMMKLTAQFVARNGQKFMLELTEREKQNPAFDFLKPNHAQFAYFTSLVDSYSKIIMPRQEELTKLQTNVREPMFILSRCGDKFEYEKARMMESKKKEELAEEERLAMAQIDWDNFVIVETITMFDEENLPAPAGAKAEAKQEAPAEEEKKDRRSALPNVPTVPLKVRTAEETPSLPIPEGDVKIKKNYVRKPAAEASEERCPLCRRMIPLSQMNDHVRIEMIDPKYKEIKKELEARSQSMQITSGNELFNNLRNFANKRPDLFGTVDEEFQAEEKPKPTAKAPQWDGTSSTMTRTSANIAMIAQQQRKNYEENLKAGGIVIQQNPAPVVPAKPGHPAQTLSSAPGGAELEGVKRLQTEEGGALIPEDQWLAAHPGPVTLRIRPLDGFDESWSVKPGESFEVTIDPRYTIGALKELISPKLGGLAAQRVKLRSGALAALKDDKTLGHYNLTDNVSLELFVKAKKK